MPRGRDRPTLPSDFRQPWRPRAGGLHVAGARLAEEAGATAVATTSAGVAWSLGVPDGDRLDRRRAVDLVARVATAVEVPVTARTDTYLRAVGDPATRLRETFARAAAYAEAGADGIFVPGVTDPDIVAALAAGVALPLNILAGPGAPDVATLAGLGAARISLGSSIAEAAYAVVRRCTREVLTTGTYTALADGLGYDELNALERD